MVRENERPVLPARSCRASILMLSKISRIWRCGMKSHRLICKVSMLAGVAGEKPPHTVAISWTQRNVLSFTLFSLVCALKLHPFFSQAKKDRRRPSQKVGVLKRHPFLGGRGPVTLALMERMCSLWHTTTRGSSAPCAAWPPSIPSLCACATPRRSPRTDEGAAGRTSDPCSGFL